jgi:lysozyme
MTPAEFEMMLIRHEGMELKPYKDTVGKLTIGVGRNLDDRGISEEEAMYLLRNDIEIHARELADRFPVVRDLSGARYYVLVNMCFNIGIHRLAGFQRMWAAIDRHDYASASLEMLDSKWAKQVGKRAEELAEIMRVG